MRSCPRLFDGRMKFELGAFNSSVIVASHEITVVSLSSAPSCVCVIIRILAQVSLLLNIHLSLRVQVSPWEGLESPRESPWVSLGFQKP